MGRVIICGDVSFPRGDPGANRILYVAQVLLSLGKDVVVLAHESDDAAMLLNNGEYKGIVCKFLKKGNGKFKKLFNRKLLGGENSVRVLKEMQCSSDDVVYIYGNNALFVQPIIKFCRKNHIKTYIDVVEWHQPYQYTGGRLSPRFWVIDYTFTHLAKRCDTIIAISNTIAEYYKKYGCKVSILPPLIDTSSQEPKYDFEETQKINIIYPGNPITKDDILTMFKGLLLLDKSILNRITFHSTGITENMLRVFLGKDKGIIDELKQTIVFHGFMPYNELIKLYQEMHFVYMSRFINRVTEANFPSKIPEIMAWGIIPICNRVGDYHRYLKDGHDAILFDGNTPESCAEALTRACSISPSVISDMKRNARECAEREFDYKVWSERINLMFR